MYVHALIPPTNLPSAPNFSAPLRIEPSLRLRRAIRAADTLLVKRILKNHPHLLHNPDLSPDGISNSNLHLAASLGHRDICQVLLDLGHERPTTALNETHQTALMLAAEGGHAETVHLLCEYDVGNVLRRDLRGRDAIIEASKNGHDTSLQILLTYVPSGPKEAVARSDLEGNTALHFASANGHLLVVRTLLAAGADASKTNHGNWPATSYSATVSAEVYIKNLAKNGLAPEPVKQKLQKQQKQQQQQQKPPPPPEAPKDIKVGRLDKLKLAMTEPGKMAGGLRMVPKETDDSSRFTPRMAAT